MKYFRDYCRILSPVIKEAKRMEYNRHILNSNKLMRTLWKLINRELGKDYKNYGFQSLNINRRSIKNHQIIASAFNDHFTTFPTMISQKINANNCSATTSDNNHNTISFSLNHVYQNPFPNIKYCCTITKVNENIITLKLSNSYGYDEVQFNSIQFNSLFP
jgi:predicted transcriptional regulator YdeE